MSESPKYVGRAVVALAADPMVKNKSGRVFSSWVLAREYGFTDLDGTRPDWGNYAKKKKYGKYKICDERFYSYWGSRSGRADFPGLVLIVSGSKIWGSLHPGAPPRNIGQMSGLEG